MNNKQLKDHVKDVLQSKNIQKLPRTLASKLDDHASAEFFGLTDKASKYEKAVIEFCDKLTAREFKNLPESVKSEELPLETLKAKAVIHARKIRALSELRQRVTEAQAEVESSLGKIPFAQREQFNHLLVELQNVIALDVE